MLHYSLCYQCGISLGNGVDQGTMVQVATLHDVRVQFDVVEAVFDYFQQAQVHLAKNGVGRYVGNVAVALPCLLSNAPSNSVRS